MRAIESGVVSRGMASSRAEWHERVRVWDGQGFDRLLLPDHLGIWPPLVPLVAAAEASDRLRLGTQVLNNEFHNPALLARDTAAADLLTDGRIELGFGAGYTRVEFDAVGIELRSPRQRIDRLEATLPAVRRLLRGETVTDEALGLEHCSLGFRAAQDHLPLLVGGNGNRLLTAAAHHADIVQLIGLTSSDSPTAPEVTHFGWDGLAERIDFVRRTAGSRRDAVRISLLLHAVAVTDDPISAARPLAEKRSIALDAVLDSPFCLIGPRTQLVEHLGRLASELGVSAVTVMEEHAGELAGILHD